MDTDIDGRAVMARNNSPPGASMGPPSAPMLGSTVNQIIQPAYCKGCLHDYPQNGCNARLDGTACRACKERNWQYYCKSGSWPKDIFANDPGEKLASFNRVKWDGAIQLLMKKTSIINTETAWDLMKDSKFNVDDAVALCNSLSPRPLDNLTTTMEKYFANSRQPRQVISAAIIRHPLRREGPVHATLWTEESYKSNITQPRLKRRKLSQFTPSPSHKVAGTNSASSTDSVNHNSNLHNIENFSVQQSQVQHSDIQLSDIQLSKMGRGLGSVAKAAPAPSRSRRKSTKNVPALSRPRRIGTRNFPASSDSESIDPQPLPSPESYKRQFPQATEEYWIAYPPTGPQFPPSTWVARSKADRDPATDIRTFYIFGMVAPLNMTGNQEIKYYEKDAPLGPVDDDGGIRGSITISAGQSAFYNAGTVPDPSVPLVLNQKIEYYKEDPPPDSDEDDGDIGGTIPAKLTDNAPKSVAMLDPRTGIQVGWTHEKLPLVDTTLVSLETQKDNTMQRLVNMAKKKGTWKAGTWKPAKKKAKAAKKVTDPITKMVTRAGTSKPTKGKAVKKVSKVPTNVPINPSASARDIRAARRSVNKSKETGAAEQVGSETPTSSRITSQDDEPSTGLEIPLSLRRSARQGNNLKVAEDTAAHAPLGFARKSARQGYKSKVSEETATEPLGFARKSARRGNDLKVAKQIVARTPAQIIRGGGMGYDGINETKTQIRSETKPVEVLEITLDDDDVDVESMELDGPADTITGEANTPAGDTRSKAKSDKITPARDTRRKAVSGISQSQG